MRMNIRKVFCGVLLLLCSLQTLANVVYQDANVRFTLIDEGTLRLEYAPDGKFVDNKSFMAVIREYPKVNYNIKNNTKQVVINTSKLKLVYKKGTGPFSKENLTISSAKTISKSFVWKPGMKQTGNLKQLIVMGCLSERYLHELKGELPEVDRFYGKFDWEKIISDLGRTYHKEACNSRRITTPGHYAYLKISEGCNRTCSYCAIPIITGAHKSRPIEDILSEVQELVSKGVKEFQVIAQELTYYGLDIYKERKIAELVERIALTPGVEWIRLHYAYPTQFPLELLKVMAKYDNVCKYLDIALQHCSDSVLANMHRNITKEQTYSLLENIRREVPGIHIRTTLMVGYPGETDADFDELVDFVKWAKFERMGAFAYSE